MYSLRIEIIKHLSERWRNSQPFILLFRLFNSVLVLEKEQFTKKRFWHLFTLRKTHNTLQLPVFFFFSFFLSFFCKPYPGLGNCKLIFLILKISHYGGSRRWVQLYPRSSLKYWYKNWYLHFYMTYDHQIWQAGTSTGVHSSDTNQAGAGDVIM